MHYPIIISALFILSINAATVSLDARCGSGFGTTCLNSKFGNCCSQYGYCGSTADWCGTGCQTGYGTCYNTPLSSSKPSSSTRVSSTSTRSSTTSSRSPTPSVSQTLSQGSRCGADFGGQTCLGSQWGDCCSQYFYCGNTNAYCSPQSCQAGYGRCDPISSSRSSTRSSTSTSRSSPLATTRTSSATSQTSSQSSSATRSSSSSSLVASSSSSFLSSPSPLASSSSSSSSFSPLSSSSSSPPASSSASLSTLSSASLSASSTQSSLPTSSSSVPLPTTCNPGGPQPTFRIQLGGNAKNYFGQYAVSMAEVLQFQPLIAGADTFTFNYACQLVAIQSSTIGNTIPGSDDSPLYMDTSDVIAGQGLTPAVCKIESASLTCATPRASVFYLCNSDNYLNLAARAPNTNDCGTPTLIPVYM